MAHGAPVSISMVPVTSTIIAGDTVTYTVTAYDDDSIAWDVSTVCTLEVRPDSGITILLPRVTGIYRRDGYSVV